MPDAVQTFIQRFPDVKVDAYEASTGVVYEYLATGKVDIAIVLQSTASSKLVLQKLITEPLLLMVGKSHPLALANSVRRETLGELDLTMPSTLHGSRALLERYCEDGGVQLDPRLRLDSLAMTKAVVTSGRVCAVLPAQAFVSEIERGEIIALPLRPALKRTVYLATLKDRHVTPQIRAMALEITRVVKGKLATSQAKF
jgi:LysR family nitrogen assimilation transcriptional regulator